MSQSELHSSILDFKKFINEHSEMRAMIRKSGDSWQFYYDKWNMLGEEDSFWDKYKNTEREDKHVDVDQEKNTKASEQAEVIGQLIKFAEKIDLNKIEQKIGKFNNTINMIQGLLGEFVNNKDSQKQQHSERKPFNLFRD